jgi:hypothetical protein
MVWPNCVSPFGFGLWNPIWFRSLVHRVRQQKTPGKLVFTKMEISGEKTSFWLQECILLAG